MYRCLGPILIALVSSAAALETNDISAPLSAELKINPIWPGDDTSTMGGATILSTYTTVTICPVTRTQSTSSSYSIYTTLTTSTMTITSRVEGSQPTSTGFIPYPISNSTFPRSSDTAIFPSYSLSTGTGTGTSTLAQTFPTGTGISPPLSGVTGTTNNVLLGTLGTGIPPYLAIPTPTSVPTSQYITTTGSVESVTTVTSVGTTAIESTTMNFIPQSILAGISGTSSYYSTYLSLSYSTFDTFSTTTSFQVILPSTTFAAEYDALDSAATSSPAGNCPPAQTIYSTVYVTVTAGDAPLSPQSSSAEALDATTSDSPLFGSTSEYPLETGATDTYLPYGTGTPNAGLSSATGTASTYPSSGTGTGSGSAGVPTPSANGTYLGSALTRRWLSPLF
ncbi:hypothetical protein MMC14_002928 [Varicellaria rhodocarpa]|nr:hypothetical protein [Varicellaria rhodocarpa]